MRNAGRLKLGYFPLPPQECRRLHRLVSCGETFSVIDPCVGTGLALQLVTESCDCRRYGVELGAERASMASRSAIETIQGNLFDTNAKVESFSMLYLNPPYDSEIGSFNNQRMELLFLEHTYRWLVVGGLLMFVVPKNRRLGQLEYLRSTTTIQTRVRLHVDRFVGEHEQGHLLSVYGGDAEVGAIAAAVYEGHSFSLRFPDGASQKISMGQDASCYRAGIVVRGRKQSLRHLVIASQALHRNGAAGKTYLLNYERTSAWATMASLLGEPADPRWADWILERLEDDQRVVELQGIGCEPVLVTATRDRLLAEISEGLKIGKLGFPEENGPVLWPSLRIQDLSHVG